MKFERRTGTYWKVRPQRVTAPYRQDRLDRDDHLSKAGHVEPCLNLRRPCRKAKYIRKTDSGPVP